MILVTNCDSHITTNEVSTSLDEIGWKHLFVAPKDIRSDGQKDNFVKVLKTVDNSITTVTIDKLMKSVNTFLMQNRDSKHSPTRQTAQKLLDEGIYCPNMRSFQFVGVRCYHGNDFQQSTEILVKNVWICMVRILDTKDLGMHNLHLVKYTFRISIVRILCSIRKWGNTR